MLWVVVKWLGPVLLLNCELWINEALSICLGFEDGEYHSVDEFSGGLGS